MAVAADVDPVTFEIIRHKLYSVMDETIIALENVSGSPITNEGHDLMASLYKADGGLMVGGVGFLHHLTSAAQAVKHILATYADDPGKKSVVRENPEWTVALYKRVLDGRQSGLEGPHGMRGKDHHASCSRAVGRRRAEVGLPIWM